MKKFLWIIFLSASIPVFSQTSTSPDTSSSKRDGTVVKEDRYDGQLNKPSTIQTKEAADDEPPIKWSNPAIPDEARRKHRTGLGLVISGTGLVVGGIVIAAGAANSSSTTYSNGTYTQSYVKVNGLGVLGILAGLPMVIVGAVKLTRANRIARNSMMRVK